MGGWIRRWLAVIVGLILVGGFLALTGWAFRLPASERSDVLTLIGIVSGLVGVLPVVEQFRRRYRAADSRSVSELAELLAQAVGGQWRQEATERRLIVPDPIPIRWSLSDAAVTGSVAAAIGAPQGPPAFPPLPQQARITEADLHDGGGRAELHNLYSGLAAGRIIVVGEPGAGKSGTAILLLLDALAHRERLTDTERARVPVPVLLTAHGWDPRTCSTRDWLIDQLTRTYPQFQHRGGDAEVAALLDAGDKVALILDGLDEIDEALRPVALQALNDAAFRVVVLTRTEEMVRAASRAWLVGATAVRLHPVSTPDAVDYLRRARTGPPPAGWTELLQHLNDQPSGVLARGLSAPLTLTLLRDTYHPDDDVRALLDPGQFPTIDTLKDHLIARVLPAAYTPRPGKPPPAYTEAQARKTLTCIARNMGNGRDLAWWHIPLWIPAAPRALSRGFIIGLGVALGFGLKFGLWVGLVFGLAFGLAAGHLGGFREKRLSDDPGLMTIASWPTAISRRALPSVIVQGFGMGLMAGLIVAVALVLWDGLGPGFVVGLAAGLLALLAVSVLFNYAGNLLWVLGAVVLWVALSGGFADGSAGGPGFTGWLRLVVGLGFVVGLGLAVALVVGLNASEIVPTTLAWLLLWLSGQVAAVRLMNFLEDARKRDILRTVGTVYQFRHAKLQDQLAGRIPAKPASSPTMRPSPPSAQASPLSHNQLPQS